MASLARLEVPLVSILDEGIVERAWIELDECAGDTSLSVEGMKDGGGVVQQLSLAREIAARFLSEPYLSGIVHRDVSRGEMTLRLETGHTYVGHSFGMSFLIGCLALGLDARLRSEHLFSAGISPSLVETVPHPLRIQLVEVENVPEKLGAANRAAAERLFIASDDRLLIDAERRVHHAQLSRRLCIPTALPTDSSPFSVAAALALGVDCDEILSRAEPGPATGGLALCVLAGAQAFMPELSLSSPLSSAIVQCRCVGGIQSALGWRALASALGQAGIEEPEALLWRLAQRALPSVEGPAGAENLICALVSSQPDRPLLPVPGGDDGTLLMWCRTLSPSRPEHLEQFLAVFQDLSRFAFDTDVIWPSARRFLRESLAMQFNQLAAVAASDTPDRATAYVEHLVSDLLAFRIARCEPEWVEELEAAIHDLLGKLAKRQETLIRAIRYLDIQCQQVRDPICAELIPEGEYDGATFLFAIAQPESPVDRKPLPNNLVLTMSAAGGISLTVRSPVLLFEHAAQLSPLVRRAGFRVADDTLAQFPDDEAKIISDRFAHRVMPTTIGFQVRRDGPPAVIRWLPDLCPWPPAIDSQLLASSIVEHADQSSPQSILDAGCGTGFLAIVAAHAWPSVKDICILDVDPNFVRVASANLESDSITRGLEVTRAVSDFGRFNDGKFDAIVSNPPYLPGRPLPSSRIQQSTDGTHLLELLVTKGPSIASELWIVFSSIAWPEFERAISRVRPKWCRLECVHRSFVPFRVQWLEPRPQEHQQTRREKEAYYHRTLIPRGLIDLDAPPPWLKYLEENSPRLPPGIGLDLLDSSGSENQKQFEVLQGLEHQSRGYRFWHEVRVLRLRS